jgi:stage II sporulation protein Q
MKKRKLKAFVLPTAYILVVSILFISICFLGTTLQENVGFQDRSTSTIDEEEITPVIKEEVIEPTDTTSAIFIKPFTSDKVKISKSYYDKDDDETVQQNSLMYYEKTYLQNSGILYSSEETFDILSVYDGKVTNVAEDDILGNYVEITHNTNLKTIYYSLSEVTVKKDDAVTTGMIIGKSGTNSLEESLKNNLLIEVYYNGFTINPENLYNATIDDFS